MDRPAIASSEPTRSPLSLFLEEEDRARALSNVQGSPGRVRPPLPDPNKKPPLRTRRNQSYGNLHALTRPPPVPTSPKPASKRRSLPAMNLVSPRSLAQAMQKEDATQNAQARPSAVSQPPPPAPEPPATAIPHSTSDSAAAAVMRRNSSATEPKPLQISAPAPRSTSGMVSSTPEKKSTFFGLITKKSSSSIRDLAIGDDVWMQTALRPSGIWQQQGKGSFILPAVAPIPLRVCEQWCYEAGRSSASLIGPFHLVEEERALTYYKDFMAPHQHTVYLGWRGNDPIILTVEKFRAERRKLKALVRHPQSDERMFFPPAPLKDTIKTLFPDAKLYKCDSDAVQQALVAFEANVRYGKELKLGILYQRKGQRTEDEIYGNNAGSPEFQEFLEWIGTRIELKNWTKFRGGLNTTTNSTGVYSVYTTYHDIEIMFHVAMFIPFSVDDVQQVERKRHAGNDTVVIVFRDMDCTEPFDPAIFKSHFNHVFCIVQVAPSTEHGRQYRIAFAFRDGVAQYGPYLPIARSFSKSAELRQLLLAKLINSDRAALHAPAIRSRLVASRKMLLQDLVDTYGKRKKR